jgi:hypothetical protein
LEADDDFDDDLHEENTRLDEELPLLLDVNIKRFHFIVYNDLFFII